MERLGWKGRNPRCCKFHLSILRNKRLYLFRRTALPVHMLARLIYGSEHPPVGTINNEAIHLHTQALKSQIQN